MTRCLLLSLLILVTLLLGPASVAAQGAVGDAAIDRQLRALTDRLNCPLCVGQTLTECPLRVCDEMRDLIRQKLLAGESEAQIVAYFVERYGERVLNEPPRRGFALLGWVTPALALLAGVAVVTLVLRGMTRPRPAVPVAAPASPAAQLAELPPEYVERVERDLRTMESRRGE